MRTMLQERHRPYFISLNSEQMDLVWRRVVEAWPVDMREFLGTPPGCPTNLFETCRMAGLDHARVVLALAREHGTLGRSTIETLVGHPIVPWAETVEAARPPSPNRFVIPPIKEGEEDSELQKTLDRSIVISVQEENPHREGTRAWTEYRRWVVGKTVGELIQRGMSRRAARRGPRNGWVKVELPK